MDKTYKLIINGREIDLPILKLDSGISVAFFNLHGNSELTEFCGKELAKLADGCDVLLTAESKGLQLAHVVARELNMPYYAVARKDKKVYMKNPVCAEYATSIIGGDKKVLYLSENDAKLLKGKKVGIIDDVVSTGASLKGLEKLVELSGGNVYKKLFVLAEGLAKDRNDVIYLASIPIF